MSDTNLLERVARLEVEVIALRKKVGIRRAYLPPWLRGQVVDFERWVRGVRNPSPALPASGEGEETDMEKERIDDIGIADPEKEEGNDSLVVLP